MEVQVPPFIPELVWTGGWGGEGHESCSVPLPCVWISAWKNDIESAAALMTRGQIEGKTRRVQRGENVRQLKYYVKNRRKKISLQAKVCVLSLENKIILTLSNFIIAATFWDDMQ